MCSQYFSYGVMEIGSKQNRIKLSFSIMLLEPFIVARSIANVNKGIL